MKGKEREEDKGPTPGSVVTSSPALGSDCWSRLQTLL